MLKYAIYSVLLVPLLFVNSVFAGDEAILRSEIKALLLQRIQSLRQENPQAELTFFVDWDGTMIKGDITEGLSSGSSEDYMGLAKLAFEQKLIHIPLGEPETFEGYFAKYERLLSESHEKAYAWSSEYFANLPPEKQLKLTNLVKEHFRKTLGTRVFETSALIVEFLHRLGVHVFVISASPLAFVEGTLEVFPWLKAASISGIDRERTKGVLRDPIINYADGKIERINFFSRNFQDSAIVGGLGNSWGTDGAFLQEISARGGVSVIFNAGTPIDRYNIHPIKQFEINDILGSKFIYSSLRRCIGSLNF